MTVDVLLCNRRKALYLAVQAHSMTAGVTKPVGGLGLPGFEKYGLKKFMH